MFKSKLPYAIWSIWVYLPVLQRLVFLVLCVLGIYCLFSAAIIMTRLRNIPRLLQKNENVASFQPALAALRKRAANMQHFIGAVFYLFGLALFVGLQSAYFTIDSSRTPPGWFVLRDFQIYFAFAANVFSVLLTLHLVQWFVSGRVDACCLQVGARQMA